MKFVNSKIQGAFVIEIEKILDDRGYFARLIEKKELQERGLIDEFIQFSISHNLKKGTFRGMHFQLEPYSEVKMISCVKGKIFDIILDLRKNSPTFLQWESNELDADSHSLLYIPKGVAHGFQTLENNTEVFYQMSEEFREDYYSGVRWNDPSFDIKLPLSISSISEKDSSFTEFKSN